MNRAKYILELLNKNKDGAAEDSLELEDRSDSTSIEIDDIFQNKDLYESAPPSTAFSPTKNDLPSIPPPSSAPPAVNINFEVTLLEDLLQDNRDISEDKVHNDVNEIQELRSPYSDISGIKLLHRSASDSSPVRDFSDSSVSWYPNSDEDRSLRKKRHVVVSASSSDNESSDESAKNKQHDFIASSISPGTNNIISNVSDEHLNSTLDAISSNENGLKRWKKSDPSKWKKNQSKMNRQSCLTYQGKKGKIMPAKKPKPVNCDVKCRYKCLEIFTEEDRIKFCQNYWKIKEYASQKQYLLQQIITIPLKTMKTGIAQEKHRCASYAYYFDKNETRYRVCKHFFQNTLCISNGPINEALKNKDDLGLYVGVDKRGSRDPTNKTDLGIEQKVIDHINSFPRQESHYCRKNTKRQYLDSTLTIAKMYELYKDKLKSAGETPCSLFVYKRIFGSKFNLSFFRPKKDLCTKCTRYDIANRPVDLKEDYDEHILKKNAAQEAKEADKQRSFSDETYLVVTADMQSTLHIPVSGVGLLYYTRKLNVQNYTIHTAKPPNEAYCITWNEINGKRGSAEIATAINWWIGQVPSTVKEITMYSDTCAGQNRNQYITAFLAHLIQRQDLHVEILEQKYLESGHTHMEVDSMHSAIERQQRNTPVYSMIDWKNIMSRARSKRHRESAPPYVVKEMTYDEMLDVRALHEKYVRNTNKDKDGKKVMWLKIKCLRFERQSPGVVKFRYSHDGPYSEFDIFEKQEKVIRTRKRRAQAAHEVNLYEDRPEDLLSEIKSYTVPKAYLSPLPISEAKKRDLISLCTKGIIPQELHNWYHSLPTSKDAIDALCEPDVLEECDED